MSLIALSVLDRQGTPLYLRDYTNSNNNSNNNNNYLFDLDGQLGDGGDSDLFDDDETTQTIPIKEMTTKQKEEWPCRLKYQFTLHAAYQRMEDVLRENQWKAPGASGMDSCWVGFLCLSDNLRAYGYVTTNARYIALIEDSIENVQLQKSRENELCVLMANSHRFHTEITMNPFVTPHTKIASKRFDLNVTNLVHNFNGSGH